MRLSGKIRIEFTDLAGNHTRKAYEQKNLIFEASLLNILGFQPNNSPHFLNSRISISTQATTPVASNPILTGIIATGSIPSGVVSPAWYESVTPNFGEIQNQISAVSNPRTFYTVGLTNLSSGNQQNNLSTSAFSYVLLSLPCTQEAFEVLTIFYRIEIQNTAGQRLSARFTRDFGGRLFGIKQCFIDVVGASWVDPPKSFYKDAFHSSNDTVTTNAPNFRYWTTGNRIDNHSKWKQSTTFRIAQSGNPGDVDDFIGYIFNSLLVGISNNTSPSGSQFISGGFAENVRSAYRVSRYRAKTVNIDPSKPVFQPPFQKIWGHRSSATVPFFDSTTAQQGNGKLLTSGTWTGKLPQLYSFVLGASGAVGTSTYRFRRRWHLGFTGNNYTDRTVGNPYRNPNTQPADGMHGWRKQDNDLLRWSESKLIQYDDTGVTLLDIFDGSYQNWDATTTPALPITQARQCAVDPAISLIYVACRVSGLWVINTTTNTITQAVAIACYGVDIGRNGVAYALFEGSLRSSTNWAVSLTFSYTTLTNGFWSRALFLKADPDPALTSDRLGIIMTSPTAPATNRRAVWWDSVTTTTTTGPDTTSLRQWAASLDVSDTGSFWATNGLRLTFNSAATSSLSTITGETIVHSVWGSQSLYKIAFFGQFLFTNSTLVNATNVIQATYTNLDGSATLCHMIGGIVVMSDRIRQAFTDNVYAWEDWGWNGSQWVKGSTSLKPTHADNQALIEGLQIKFENGANAPHFFTGDFYTQGILWGTWKDNATSIYYENFWYVRPVYFDTALPNGLNVPVAAPYEVVFPVASQPDFLRIETDSIKELTDFAIAGVPVATVYGDGSPPGVNEVSVVGVNDVSGMARMIFNAADAGKTISGTYAWIGV